MVVIDTSAWIEWLRDSATADLLAAQWPPLNRTIAPTLVLLELAKWAERESAAPLMARVMALASECWISELDTRTALAAARVSVRQRLPTADAVIYATALQLDAQLLTCDAHFKDLPSVIYIPKA
jgi:predicted nucleic acid-binding protein